MKKLILNLSLALLSIPTFSQTAEVQLIHNSADAAASSVDIYIQLSDGATLVIDDLDFRNATPTVGFPPDSVIIAIAPSNSLTIADSLISSVYDFKNNECNILVIDGLISTSGYTPLKPLTMQRYIMGRSSANTSGNTDVLVHHGATDAPTVDIDEVTAGNLVDDISYGEFSTDYLELLTADYKLDVKNAAGTATVARYSAPLSTLGLEDTAIVVVASGFLDPSVNSNGPAFGLWAAVKKGGPLVELPEELITSVKDLSNITELSIYPNPTNNNLYIDGVELNETVINIYDISGKIVKSFVAKNNVIDVSNLENGTYHMVLSTNSGIYQNKSFVKF